MTVETKQCLRCLFVCFNEGQVCVLANQELKKDLCQMRILAKKKRLELLDKNIYTLRSWLGASKCTVMITEET